ncbi:MAG: DegV family protein [Eubacteriales bacterium]|nr:DegV family protein [Eubacteriales bacterium]
MSKYVILCESGSDVSPELAERYNITIVPMHVNFGEETRDDGKFPVTDVFDYYKSTGVLPKTSASNVADFEKAFDELHEKYPESRILYLAYSSVTTCTYQSAVIAGEGRDYITYVDTKGVSAGQCLIVLSVARYLEKHPDVELPELLEVIDDYIKRGRMGFFPGDLDYLRAGGRVSNAAYLGARLLSLNPLIIIDDGRLVADKKYRGSMEKVSSKLVYDFTERFDFDKELIIFVFSPGLSDKIKANADAIAKELGFKEILWVQTGCVVGTHGGPGAFGVIGFSKA